MMDIIHQAWRNRIVHTNQPVQHECQFEIRDAPRAEQLLCAAGQQALRESDQPISGLARRIAQPGKGPHRFLEQVVRGAFLADGRQVRAHPCLNLARPSPITHVFGIQPGAIEGLVHILDNGHGLRQREVLLDQQRNLARRRKSLVLRAVLLALGQVHWRHIKRNAFFRERHKGSHRVRADEIRIGVQNQLASHASSPHHQDQASL
jgi:hypothetical protein